MYASIGGWPSAEVPYIDWGLLLLIIMIGSMFIERFFCRYLCPIGAVFALVSKLRLFHIEKKTVKAVENAGYAQTPALWGYHCTDMTA